MLKSSSNHRIVGPFVVLGVFKPPKFRASLIGKALTNFTQELGLTPLNDPEHGAQTTSTWCDEKLHAEVRRFVQPTGQGSGWHKDGDLADGSKMDHAAVLWSAVTPTEFKDSEGLVWRPKPFEIVIARNLACHHRTPPDAPQPPERRWFFRQRVEVPSHVELP
jgi:hypothetical protein